VHLLVLLLFVWPRQRATLWRTTRPGRQILRGLMMLAMPALFVVAAARLRRRGRRQRSAQGDDRQRPNACP